MPTFQLTIDCSQPARLVRFWSDALGYLPEPPPAGFADWISFWRSVGVPEAELGGDGCDSVIDPAGRGPRIWFQRVAEAKELKNRLHLDLDVGGGRQTPLSERRRRITAECDRLVGAGARKLRERDEAGQDHFAIVMQDPEGNEFCLH